MEISPNNRAKCRSCREKLSKGLPRIKKYSTFPLIRNRNIKIKGRSKKKKQENYDNIKDISVMSYCFYCYKCGKRHIEDSIKQKKLQMIQLNKLIRKAKPMIIAMEI